MSDEDERVTELRAIAGRMMEALTAGGVTDVEYDEDEQVIKAYDDVTEHEISIEVAFR